MCCQFDYKRDLKPTDWTPCVECIDDDEWRDFQAATGATRRWGAANGTRVQAPHGFWHHLRRAFSGRVDAD